MGHHRTLHLSHRNHMWQLLKPVKTAQEKQLRSNPASSIARADHSGVNPRSSDIFDWVPESKIVNHYCTPVLVAGHSGAPASGMLMKSTALSAYSQVHTRAAVEGGIGSSR